VNGQYLIPLPCSLLTYFTHTIDIIRGIVCSDNNIFVMEVRQVFYNIWVFKDRREGFLFPELFADVPVPSQGCHQ
jgi:hypothetical protein